MEEGSSGAPGALLGTEAGEGAGAVCVTGDVQAAALGREYRKGNWTLHETVVLIAAKKKDEERRLRGGDRDKTRTAELRWKWIENYCWHNGCHRNQNQCNDKWDNLLRDYKKVREHEMRLPPVAALSSPSSSSHAAPLSYWQLEKHERKEKGLPSNLLFQVYEALHDIVDRRHPLRAAANHHHPPPPPALAQPPSLPPLSLPPLLPPPHLLPQDVYHLSPSPAQPHLQHPHLPILSPGALSSKPPPLPSVNAPQLTPAAPPLPPEFHPTAAAATAAPPDETYPSESSESHDSEVPPSPAKRRRVGEKGPAAAVVASTAELTQALLACEERKDRRHRDLLNVEERKLMLETTKTQISREGIAGLIAAINNLAEAVVSLASDKSLGTAD